MVVRVHLGVSRLHRVGSQVQPVAVVPEEVFEVRSNDQIEDDAASHLKFATDPEQRLVDREILALCKQVKEMKSALNVAYHERNLCVAALCRMALCMGWEAGLGKDADQPQEWRNVVFILINGVSQVSWHIHESELPVFSFLGPFSHAWDGHSTELKYQRLQNIGRPLE